MTLIEQLSDDDFRRRFWWYLDQAGVKPRIDPYDGDEYFMVLGNKFLGESDFNFDRIDGLVYRDRVMEAADGTD